MILCTSLEVLLAFDFRPSLFFDGDTTMSSDSFAGRLFLRFMNLDAANAICGSSPLSGDRLFGEMLSLTSLKMKCIGNKNNRGGYGQVKLRLSY